ncbi:hypothetical protein [Microvirga arvi]|nr:hypothetical protein [Microvirga arvi]
MDRPSDGILYFGADGSGNDKGLAIVQLEPGQEFSRSDFVSI